MRLPINMSNNSSSKNKKKYRKTLPSMFRAENFKKTKATETAESATSFGPGTN
jgi:hypothetical protein